MWNDIWRNYFSWHTKLAYVWGTRVGYRDMVAVMTTDHTAQIPAFVYIIKFKRKDFSDGIVHVVQSQSWLVWLYASVLLIWKHGGLSKTGYLGHILNGSNENDLEEIPTSSMYTVMY